MEAVKITGLSDCLRLLDAGPANALKMSRTALKEASRATTRKVRSNLPKRWRHLVSYKVVKTATGKLSSRFGLYNKHQRKGSQRGDIDDWFKAYWKNYGTLSRRDSQHHFQSPVKKNVAHKSNGQRAEHFFEEATAGWERTFTKEFSESMKRNEDKLYNR